jgi:hypothetical protein
MGSLLFISLLGKTVPWRSFSVVVEFSLAFTGPG